MPVLLLDTVEPEQRTPLGFVPDDTHPSDLEALCPDFKEQRSPGAWCVGARPIRNVQWLTLPQGPYDAVCKTGPRERGPHDSEHGATGSSRSPWRGQKAADQGLCGPIARNADIPAPAGCVGMGIRVRSARVGR